MPIDFPNTPTLGQSFTSGSMSWTYDGEKWVVTTQPVMPAGSVIMWSTSTAPTGWLLCDGTTYNIASYPTLGALLGSRYGGDGTTTFAVPNAGDKLPFGWVGAANAYGASSTSNANATHTHSITDLTLSTYNTSHSHTVSGTTSADSTHTHGAGNYAVGQGNHAHTHNAGNMTAGSTNIAHAHNYVDGYPNTGGSSSTKSTGNAGGSHGHDVGGQSSAASVETHNHTFSGTSGAGSTHSHTFSDTISGTTIHTHTLTTSALSNADALHSHGLTVVRFYFIIKT